MSITYAVLLRNFPYHGFSGNGGRMRATARQKPKAASFPAIFAIFMKFLHCFYLNFILPHLWYIIRLLFPFRNPMNPDTLIFGGIVINMWI